MKLTAEQKRELYDVLDSTENSVVLYAIADYIQGRASYVTAASEDAKHTDEIQQLVSEQRQSVLDCAERIAACEKIMLDKQAQYRAARRSS